MKTKTVSLKDLKTNLFVRTALNQDHVLYLADLIENGIILPPIMVDAQMNVIDGRHRIEAHEVALRTEIVVQIVEINSEAEMIAQAFKANIGGSLPPTKSDTEHTIALLLERNVPMKQIADSLGLPLGMIRGYVTNVKSKLSRAKVQRAVDAVTDGGLTAAAAAETHGVEIEKIKEAISGGKRNKRTNGVSEIQRLITFNAKSNSSKTASLVRKLLDKYEDGDVTAKQVLEILDHIDQLQKKGARALADWRKRFEAMKSDAVKAA